MGKQVKVTVRPVDGSNHTTYRRDGREFSRTAPTVMDEDEITEVMRSDPLLVIHGEDASVEDIRKAEHIPSPSTAAQMPEAIAAEKEKAQAEAAPRSVQEREARESEAEEGDKPSARRPSAAEVLRQAQGKK